MLECYFCTDDRLGIDGSVVDDCVSLSFFDAFTEDPLRLEYADLAR